ncbi:hypothetical protein [Pseudanabaena sp. FACHB-2040]|uniref:hypothetical protein n=1 Tax=Pseudanabaena sp. FACHB-2040 TaxID=2692859 RepID=UPI0016838036|nr:hypothetical protein [Pseudanabaena sp. FACHB-2040]MBD2259141.1 hypothetical protein [Pseudanabaena sp. FACHB-2040]
MKSNNMIANNGRNGKRSNKPAAKLSNLPVEQKACLFILLMGILGVVVGGTGAEFEMRAEAGDQQFHFDAAQQRLDGAATGAYAGMGAAVAMSLPAIAKRLRG